MKTFTLQSFFSFMLILSFVTSCDFIDRSEDNPAESGLLIPKLTISCSGATECSNNNAQGKLAHVLIVAVSSGSTYAIGQTSVTCNSGTCSGEITSYKNASLTTITRMPEGAYRLSVFIDSKSPFDGNASVGEARSTQYITTPLMFIAPTPSVLTINNSWEDILSM